MTSVSATPASPERHGFEADDLASAAQTAAARVIGVSKSFGGVQALVDVSLDLRAGEVHALCGENGAGKSTLIKILSGYYACDSGRVEVAGGPLAANVHAASELGVSVIHQESVACLDLDAVDNVFVGREIRTLGGLLLDRRRMERHTVEQLQRLGEHVPVDRPVGQLSLAQRQMIGMARALSQQCRVLVMDEPTASLSAREAETLFRIVRQLRGEGAAILYVSHRLEEIFALADRVTVLRDGRHVETCPLGELTPARLIELMVGRGVEPLARHRQDPAIRPEAKRLEVVGLTRQGQFAEISFSLKEGEVVGMAGLVGAGRSEVAGAIFGIDGYDDGGVLVDGEPLEMGSITASIERGLALAPEDRQQDGLVLPMSVAENLTLVVLGSLARGGLIRRQAERETAQRLVRGLDVRAARLTLPAEALSGGNQQKLVIGKWLAAKPRILILDEPTRGVDVAAKAEIHRRIRELAGEGMATLVISSELPEVLRLSDRILVMRQGRIAGELSAADATEQQILQLALPAADRESRGAGSAGAYRRGAAFDSRSPLGEWLKHRELWLFALLLAIFATVGAMKPSFLALSNLLDVGAEAAPTAIIACAVALVVITGEIDISVGSLAGLTAAVLGLCCYGPEAPMCAPAGASCALAVAVGVGAVNGLLVTVGRVPSIIATLGMLTVLRGVTTLIMGGRSIGGRPESLRELATGAWMGVPTSIWIGAAVALLLAVVACRTPLGRRMYAVGSNPQAAPLLGVSVGKVRFIAFTLAGFMTGVAALLLAPKNSIIQPNLGEGLELLVVTCVVVGGTSISGGRGSILGVVLAVIFLSLVPTALTYVSAPAEWRLAIQGSLILVAVLADHYMQALRPRGGVR
ncbi:MAG: ATP-binding cassette domain-containing protein [Pirellulales bacterium]|nr:ATP-binding cassette domain-containing protein [Pirellulales bacterium]